MSKYVTVNIAGVITAIGYPTEIDGYTESVIYRNLPTDEELKIMNQKTQQRWIKESNKFMKQLCDLMNKNM